MNNVNHSQHSNAVFHPSFTGSCSKVLREGEKLFQMGDTVDGIYILNSGAIKLSTYTVSGDQHIIRFCMPGDILGLEALTDGISRSNAEVLDIANVTLVPLSTVLNRTGDFDLGSFMEKIASTLNQEHEHSLMLSQCTAGRRLAWFLLEYSKGQERQGLSPNKFLVAMKRADMALFLGLAVETVSRELAKLCRKGVVKCNLRHIEILDLPSLTAISNAEEFTQAKQGVH